MRKWTKLKCYAKTTRAHLAEGTVITWHRLVAIFFACLCLYFLSKTFIIFYIIKWPAIRSMRKMKLENLDWMTMIATAVRRSILRMVRTPYEQGGVVDTCRINIRTGFRLRWRQRWHGVLRCRRWDGGPLDWLVITVSGCFFSNRCMAFFRISTCTTMGKARPCKTRPGSG